MMLPDMERLYAPYAKNASLEDTMKWLRKEAAGRNVPDDVRDAAIMEVFLEMAKGKVFLPTCDCGCGLTWSCSAMNHYTLKKMQEIRDHVTVTATKVLGDRLSAAILGHMQADNDAYIKEQMPAPEEVTEKRTFLDWSKSPVLNGLKASGKWIGSLLAP